MEKYLVTGGSGFCGFEIVKDLLRRGLQVRVLDVEPLPEPLSGVEFFRGDVRSLKDMEAACRGMDRVIHCVAKVPITKAGKEFWTVNVEGTRQVLEAAMRCGVKKVVHLSSSSVQLSEKNPVPEEAPFHPVGEYAKSKLAAEEVCRGYLNQGLKIDIIRPRTVVGRGRLGIFDILFEWISEGRKVYILGNGKNKIQFLHAEDLAACCYLASQQPLPHVFNVGSKDFSSLREDLQALIDEAGTRSRVVPVPVAPAVAALAVLDFLRLSPLASWHYLTYHKDFYFSNEKAKKILGWEPRYGNREILGQSYRDYLESRTRHRPGFGHRKALKQQILGLLKKIS